MSQLVSIGVLHRRRTDSAAKEVKEARAELDKAEQEVVSRQQRLDAQRIDAAREEKEIFSKFFNSVVKRKGLDDTLVDLQIIRNKTIACETDLLKSEQVRDTAVSALESARTRYRERLVKLEKFEALIDREKQEKKDAAQAAEDALIEEAVELKRKGHDF